MATESYTPGYTVHASDFMARRTLQSHGMFFHAHLKPGSTVLDCGCGPGSITLGIAEAVFPGRVTGVDDARSQIELARQRAVEHGTANLDYLTATCYALPFDDASFDCIFSHALLEHLAEPSRALAEFYRILKPGGSIGICSPDWGGFIVSPPSPALSDAIQAYMALQSKNGGDVLIGRKFGTYLHEAGFHAMSMQARYECYPSLNLIGEYLARQLARDGQQEHASTWLAWSRSPSGLFAQTWVSAIGRK